VTGLGRLKWLTAVVVSTFLLIFEYVRHFVWPELLHTIPVYLISLALVFTLILLFNQAVYSLLEKMQRDLMQQTNSLNTVIESSGNAIIGTDLKGKIILWSRGSELIYDWTKAEAIGQVLPMVPPHLRDDANQLIKRMLETGTTIYNYETQRQRKNGELIPVMVTFSPIRDAGGNIVSLLGISTDMRERKRLQQELLAQQQEVGVLRERERMAHELHDDLGQILGYVNTQSQAVRELLAHGQTTMADAALKRLVEVAQNAHGDIRTYILSLQTNVSPEQPFVPTVRAYLQQFSQHSGIQAELTVAEDLNGVQFDPVMEAQMLRIVQEALSNVRKHAGARHTQVHCALADGHVLIEVADDGQGFDPAQPPGEGQHFGQRIMRERAREIGGTIEVQSTVGQGTRVMLRVPLRTRPAQP
jgi:PAS domain S-box-containing protein